MTSWRQCTLEEYVLPHVVIQLSVAVQGPDELMVTCTNVAGSVVAVLNMAVTDTFGALHGDLVKELRADSRRVQCIFNSSHLAQSQNTSL